MGEVLCPFGMLDLELGVSRMEGQLDGRNAQCTSLLPRSPYIWADQKYKRFEKHVQYVSFGPWSFADPTCKETIGFQAAFEGPRSRPFCFPPM